MLKKWLNQKMSNSPIISYGRQSINSEDIENVVTVLKSNWLTQGPVIEEFEKALCQYFGSSYATVTANGTASLHLMAIALGWTKNDIILTTPITFLASVNCARYVSAQVDLVDIDKRFYTIDPIKIEEKILEYKKVGKQVVAVIAVDYAGQPSDWATLKEIAKKYNVVIINDFCHAMGAKYLNDSTYAAKYADAVNLSFHPVKNITTAEGGGILTNHELLNNKFRTLRTHGIKKTEDMIQNVGMWYYEMDELGYNYRLSDVHAALGVTQLSRLDDFIRKRNAIARMYDNAFIDDERFIIPEVRENCVHANHLYPLQICFEKLKTSKRDFFIKMKEVGIICQVHYIPIHYQPYYKRYFEEAKTSLDLPLSEAFYEREVSIPIFPLLTTDEVEYIIGKIKERAI